MAKAIRAFIDDAGRQIQPGYTVRAPPARLAVLCRLGLIDEAPALSNCIAADGIASDAKDWRRVTLPAVDRDAPR